ncbi:MAG: PhzF family phenazine biosynthesis protein [Bacteroidales bacterium]|nr:PhzF family phenazine biosynthesis protein [Bacteroidales bacterium]
MSWSEPRRKAIHGQSATGTANASLTYYLQQCGCLGNEAECAFIQGEVMGRPSVVTTRIQADGNLFVGGKAAIIAERVFFFWFPWISVLKLLAKIAQFVRLAT